MEIRTILAVMSAAFQLNYFTNCSEPMIENSQRMTMDELVDILAQKTQKFTQLLVYKDFGNEYKECKEAIQHILAEIELRKESQQTSNDSYQQSSSPL